MKHSAVLFDMNGVIVDDEPLHLLAFQKVLGSRGQKLTREGYKRYFAGKTDEDGFRAFMGDRGVNFELKTLLREKADAYMRSAVGTIEPYPGVIDLIKSLAATGVQLGLVTSSLQAEAKTVLSAFDISDVFEAMITAEDIRHGKPDPEGCLKGAEALGLTPEQCVVIEDAPSGVAAAKAAGMQCVVVLNTHTQKELDGADIMLHELVPGCLDDLVDK